MSFDMIMQNQNMVKKQNCVLWIQNRFWFHCIHKNRYLKICCRRFWNLICTSSYELDRALPEARNKKVFGLM